MRIKNNWHWLLLLSKYYNDYTVLTFNIKIIIALIFIFYFLYENIDKSKL